MGTGRHPGRLGCTLNWYHLALCWRVYSMPGYYYTTLATVYKCGTLLCWVYYCLAQLVPINITSIVSISINTITVYLSIGAETLLAFLPSVVGGHDAHSLPRTDIRAKDCSCTAYNPVWCDIARLVFATEASLLSVHLRQVVCITYCRSLLGVLFFGTEIIHDIRTCSLAVKIGWLLDLHTVCITADGLNPTRLAVRYYIYRLYS